MIHSKELESLLGKRFDDLSREEILSLADLLPEEITREILRRFPKKEKISNQDLVDVLRTVHANQKILRSPYCQKAIVAERD